MITNVKKLDAVKLMRDIRDLQHKRYEKHPELREKDLSRVRKKYGLTTKKTSN